jgi:hypothetical protein
MELKLLAALDVAMRFERPTRGEGEQQTLVGWGEVGLQRM